ncbi:hypothetical protein BJX63DRAFT_405145 [Aspergillus granulosus]|uniref:Uncharacterized protein n=1 Tax=Aspergillus granulosus TaxID=176169 RepID=A0ABR4H2S0_9EURO
MLVLYESSSRGRKRCCRSGILVGCNPVACTTLLLGLRGLTSLILPTPSFPLWVS